MLRVLLKLGTYRLLSRIQVKLIQTLSLTKNESHKPISPCSSKGINVFYKGTYWTLFEVLICSIELQQSTNLCFLHMLFDFSKHRAK